MSDMEKAEIDILLSGEGHPCPICGNPTIRDICTWCKALLETLSPKEVKVVVALYKANGVEAMEVCVRCDHRWRPPVLPNYCPKCKKDPRKPRKFKRVPVDGG